MTVTYREDNEIFQLENVDSIAHLDDSNTLFIDFNQFTDSIRIPVSQLMSIKN